MAYQDPCNTQRLALLRADLQDLAAGLGRTPTPAQVRAVVRRIGLDRGQLEDLLELTGSVAEAPSSSAPLPAAELVQPTADASEAGRSSTRHLQEVDDDWNDADPFAVDDREPTAARTAGDRLVDRLVQDLLDDRHRIGALARGDVTALAQRRGLNATQIETVLVELEAARVILDKDAGAEPYDGHNDLDGGAVRRQVGTADRDQLAAYFARAGRVPLLTAEQEVRLGCAIRAGQQASEVLNARHDRPSDQERDRHLLDTIVAGRQAHEQMVCANLRLVVSIAKLARYVHSGVEFADRIQDGNAGLLRAADKYDPDLGYKFSTYATWWIRQHIDRGIGDRGRLIRLPIHMHEQVRKVKAIRRRLELELGRPPSLMELAEHTHEQPGKLAAMLTYADPIHSLDAVVGTDGDVTLRDLLSADADIDGRLDPAQVVLDSARENDLQALLDTVLTFRQGEVIRRRYGLADRPEETLQEIADTLGVTRERVRQIEGMAMERLQGDPGARGLYEYLIDAARRDQLRTPLDDRPPQGKRKRQEMTA